MRDSIKQKVDILKSIHLLCVTKHHINLVSLPSHGTGDWVIP